MRRLREQQEQRNAMALQQAQQEEERTAARRNAFSQSTSPKDYRQRLKQGGDIKGYKNAMGMAETERELTQKMGTDQFKAGLLSWSVGNYQEAENAWRHLWGTEPGTIGKSKNGSITYTHPHTGEVFEVPLPRVMELAGMKTGQKSGQMTFQQRKDLETHKAGLKPKGAKGTEKIELPNGMSVSVNELVRLYKTQNNIFSEQELFNMEMVDPERADQARKSMAQVPSFFDWAMKTYGVNLRGKTPDPNPKGAKGSTGAPPPGGGTHAPGSGKGTPKFGSVWE